MRISDWSSDVCSSDLPRPPAAARIRARHRRGLAALRLWRPVRLRQGVPPPVRHDPARLADVGRLSGCLMRLSAHCGPVPVARTSVVQGKSVSVTVDLGGGSNTHKKKTITM